jgi:hypothetical protein
MVTEDFFQNPETFTAFKKPTPVVCEVTTTDGVVETLEGPVSYVAGARIITGPKGERYPVASADFARLYDEAGDGTATPKRIFKQVRLADHDGVIHTSWGDLSYTTGNDYIVRHGAGDYGVVKRDIFATTYSPA